MSKKTWSVVNLENHSNRLQLEADDLYAAAFAALAQLGWAITEGDAEPGQPIKRTLPVCPRCGGRTIAQIDAVTALSWVQAIDAQTGEVTEWAGESTVDWDSQHAERCPPDYVCARCDTTFSREKLLAASKKAAEENKT